MLVFSQVVLSLYLSFAVIPLVMFTGNRSLMGKFVNPHWLKVTSWAVATGIVGLCYVEAHCEWGLTTQRWVIFKGRS
ncbi:MAG: divalent metal cation transporter [Oculatellaceae cyanobacterium Prado106]|nr:divalent metal cation transporter [Oculatellaceae cyanobacterium Prado106]